MPISTLTGNKTDGTMHSQSLLGQLIQPIATPSKILSRCLENFVDNICQGLTVEQVRNVKDLMRCYQDIFEDGSKRGTNIVQHRIDTKDARPRVSNR